MKKAVIFDLDGLLIDTEPYWTEADNTILGREGYCLTPELIRNRLGSSALGAVKMYHDSFPFKYPFDKFVKERREITFRLMDKKILPMPGAIELIRACFNKGYKLAIATTAPHKPRMSKILNALEATDYISEFVTGKEVQNQKPSPDIFLLTAKKLGVNSSDCLVIEDAPSGITAAKSAGMVAYGVNSDSETMNALKEKGADKVFKSLLEIDL